MTDEAAADFAGLVTVGRVGAPYGVRGWLKLHSYTSPPQALLDYQPWFLCRPNKAEQGHWFQVEAGKQHGRGLVAKLQGIEDRSAAEPLVGREIWIKREKLPSLPPGEYYWIDLIGMQVRNLQHQDLGSIKELLETGANDVLVVQGEKERLIPYVKGHYVIEVDLPKREMIVDWPADYDE